MINPIIIPQLAKNLVYYFKDLRIFPISFAEFGGPMYTYDQLKKGDKNITISRRRAKKN